MSAIITANALKTQGVNAIDKAINDRSEAYISIRGKNKFVVLTLDQYHHLRECELEAALAETKRDIKHKKYYSESVEAHIKRIKNA